MRDGKQIRTMWWAALGKIVRAIWCLVTLALVMAAAGLAAYFTGDGAENPGLASGVIGVMFGVALALLYFAHVERKEVDQLNKKEG